MVNSEQTLAEFLPALTRATWVAVDTEADSLHAYPEKICLIQISTAQRDCLVDPLAPIDLGMLLGALSGHVLIMHGADYDLRLLRKHHEFSPGAVFDTMLAARLLGIKQFSLGDLVHRFLDVKLEKGQQKANWAIRPLSPRMEEYARNDTHYLKPLSDQLKAELQKLERLSWHEEWCNWLIKESAKPREEDANLVWRVKGSAVLERRGLAILRELWRWREHEAVRANKPPFFVLSHQGLVEISAAVDAGKSFEESLPRHMSERRRAGIRAAVERGQAVTPEHQPKPLRFLGRRPLEGEKKRYHELQQRRDTRAAELGIDPTIIASRSVLSDLAHNWEKHSPELMDWQRKLLQPIT